MTELRYPMPSFTYAKGTTPGQVNRSRLKTLAPSSFSIDELPRMEWVTCLLAAHTMGAEAPKLLRESLRRLQTVEAHIYDDAIKLLARSPGRG